MLARVPEGWSLAAYGGRRWGLSRTTRAGGTAVSVYAEELGGTDVVSTNVYRTRGGDLLRPCEMPAAAVLAFLDGWRPVGPPADGPTDAPAGGPPATVEP